VTLSQLSVFLENRPGRLSAPCRTLAQAGINILTLSLADTQQFGILRLIVRDWERAKARLEEAGSIVRISHVVAVEVLDEPGGLAHVLEILEAAGINIEYLYAATMRRENKAIIIFRFEDPDAAARTLEAKGVRVVGGDDFYSRLERQ